MACSNNNGDDGDGSGKPDACVGLECQVVNCAAMGKPSTTITGTVFAPNGTLPLFGVNVYVPRDPPPPFQEGAQCSRCSDDLGGSPIARTQTDEAGNFRLEGVPSGASVPLVITIGKWRRQIVVSQVAECTDTAVPAQETRLPKNRLEGDIPKIAVTTGSADSMECLARKLGIEDSEITNGSGAGRIHLYTGNGVSKFKSGFAGGSGESFEKATTFWNSVDNLKKYDIVILSCEGAQYPGTKPQPTLDAMKAYADAGGRVFASHWHNIWVAGNYDGDPSLAPAVWNTIATWSGGTDFNGLDAIDESSNPKGRSFADWMVNVGGSTTRGEFPVTEGRTTVLTLDTTRSERWVSRQGGAMNPQMFQFTTPNEASPDSRCGKVVFTDMHVSGTRQSGDYPDSCVGGANSLSLSPQEKALAFMFFDIASCVGVIN
ncbi:MAG: carboxypeptidase-like regulatory domain-containing protein [Kofleriaceae bacterium]